MSLIIGVVGFINSGKNSVGEYLEKQFAFRQESFAKPLKDAIASVFNWPRNLLEGNTAESRKWREMPDEWWEDHLQWNQHNLAKTFPRFTPRVCLQVFGTDVFRESFHNDIWILSLQHRLRHTVLNTVVTDCRFPNELKAIKNEKGLTLRVKRGPEPIWYERAQTANFGLSHLDKTVCYQKMIDSGIHTSEWAWVGYEFDYVIENNGTLDELHTNIAHYVRGKL